MSGSGTVSFLPTRSGALASVVTPRGGEEPRRRKQSDPSSEIKALLEDYPYQELAVEFDQHERVLWYFMAPAARPSATIGLMEDIKHLQGTVRNLFTHYQNATEQPVKYMVLGSRMPGIFNLGGDLALFGKLIADRDRKALYDYARLSISVIHANSISLDLPIAEITAVRKPCALGSERSATNAWAMRACRVGRWRANALRSGAFEQSHHRRTQRKVWITGSAVQFVSGNGSLFIPGAPCRSGTGRTHDAKRPYIQRRGAPRSRRDRFDCRRWRR